MGETNGGRRPLKIDPMQVEELAAIQCSHAEMAAVLRCSADTLERRFAAAIKKGRERGNASLKRAQFKLALSGNPTMLIWLGKIYLGQREQAVNVEVSAPGAAQSEDVPVSRRTREQAISELREILRGAVSKRGNNGHLAPTLTVDGIVSKLMGGTNESDQRADHITQAPQLGRID